MSMIQQVVVTAAAVLGIIGAGVAVYVTIKSTALDAQNKRLNTENEGYVRRLDYLEPRYDQLSREVQTLRDLHNPAQAIEDVAAAVGAVQKQEQANHQATYDVLTDIRAILRETRA